MLILYIQSSLALILLFKLNNMIFTVAFIKQLALTVQKSSHLYFLPTCVVINPMLEAYIFLSCLDLFLHFLFKIIWIFTLTFIFNNSWFIFFLRFLGLIVFDLDLVFTVSVLFCLYFFILFFQNLILFKVLQILILLLWVMLLYFFFYFAFDLRNLLFLSFYWILALLIIL